MHRVGHVILLRYGPARSTLPPLETTESIGYFDVAAATSAAPAPVDAPNIPTYIFGRMTC